MHNFLIGLLAAWVILTSALGNITLVIVFLENICPKIKDWLCVHNIHWKRTIVKWNKRCRWCLTDWTLNSEDEWVQQ